MRWTVVAARAPLVVALALVLSVALARSSLVALLPFPYDTTTWLYVEAALVIALLPALLTRGSPTGAAAMVVVPVLAAAAYGASRLDWLRVLKDFGVQEASGLDPWRLALGALALVLWWALHATDLALRLRDRSLERGIERWQADAAARIVARRCAEAAGVALAGAMGLLGVAVLGARAAGWLPTERAALVAPLVAAVLLVAVAVWLATESSAKRAR